MNSMKPIRWVILASASIFCGVVGSSRAEVTFSKDVLAILQKNCQECHRPGEAVPMSLVTYKDVRPWVKSIKKVVTEGVMPPWHADPAVGKWKNERRLSKEELATLVSWIDAGAPIGDAEDLPPAPKFSRGWKIGEPDATFSFSRDEVLPATLEDQYRYVTMKTNFPTDRWLKAIECRPGNVEAVHHIIAFTKPAGLDIASAQKGMGKPGTGLSGALGGVSLLGGYAPGMNPFKFSDGTGILLPAGCEIVFQMHYHKEKGAAARDRSSIGLKFADYPITKQYRADAVFTPLLMIPPGAEHFEVNAMPYTAAQDMELRTVLPHMHLRGKDMKVWAKFPDGTEKDIIWVPRYDFNWQTIYELADPLYLPKGTKLFAKAHYNNSSSNPANPNPAQTVTFGEATTDEMMFAFLSYTLPNEHLNQRDPSFVLVGAGASAGGQ